MTDLKQLCISVCTIAKQVAAFIRQESLRFDTNKIEYKGWNNLVSYVDKTAEEMLIKQLAALLPGSGFIAEEDTVSENDSEFKWIIDPLDGTTNFTHGCPPYCVSIALLQQQQLVLGVIAEPNFDECFYAYKNGGAYLNDKPIHVSQTETLRKSLIATGFPYTRFDRKSAYMDVFDYCMHHTQGLRRLGSAAIDMAYVACGRFDAFYEYGLKPWDVAAGFVIINEAGGSVSDFSGGNNYLFGEEIIASNGRIHPEFLELVVQKFKR